MQTLEKRSSESVIFDVDCSQLLASGETISSVSSVSATPSGLSFGLPVVNTAPVTYTDAFGSTRTAAIGKVVQVQISAGSIPANAQTQDFIVRVKVVTSLNPLVEATVRLRLNDTP